MERKINYGISKRRLKSKMKEFKHIKRYIRRLQMQNETELRQEGLTIYNKTVNITVKSDEDYKEVAELAKKVKSKISEVETFFKPMVQAAFQAHKEIKNKENEFLRPLEDAQANIRQALNQYATEQEAKRRAEQQRLEAIARAEAEKERLKLLKQAEKAALKGKEVQAEDLKTQAENVYAEPVFAPAVKSVELDNGKISTVKDIEIKIMDRNLFLQFAIENLPDAVIDINLIALKKYIKAMKIKSMAGLSIIEKSNVVIR